MIRAYIEIMPKKKDPAEVDGVPFAPRTLQEAITYFADSDVTHAFATALRWPEGVFCPNCGSAENSFISTRKLWKCKGCKKQFSVRVGTIFEDSPIALSKWFVAIWMIANCKNGVSSYELHRAVGVTQKTAWFMLHRLRAAMKARSFDRKLAGIVETDECFIGGLFENMHKKRVETIKAGRKSGPIGKTLVQAVLERDGEIRAQIIKNLSTMPRFEFLKQNVEKGAHVMTDEGSMKLTPYFLHDFVNHSREYVRGNVHTNGVENFWALLRRGLTGTYVNVEPFHLSAYVEEQCFRFNNRKAKDGDRFVRMLALTKGVRLTYKQLTIATKA